MRKRVHLPRRLLQAIFSGFLIISLANVAVAQAPISNLGSHSQTPDLSPPVSRELDIALADAQKMANEGRANDAEPLVRQYLKKHFDSPDGHFLLGYILFRQVQQRALEKALTTEPTGSHGSGVPKPDANLKNSKVKASLAEYTEGAKYRDPSSFDLKIVALDYVLLADYVDADKWLTRMLEWTPNDADGWYYLGRAKYNEGRFAEAVHAFEQCLKLSPQNVKAEDNLGLSYAGLGRTDEAMTAYKNAITWQNSSVARSPEPHIDMGSLLLDQDRAEESIPYLQEAISISSLDPKPHELLGKAYARLNRYELAQDQLETALRLEPQNPHIPCMLGPVYRKRGLQDQANLQFERCAKLNESTRSTPANSRP